jgi:PadR family transcriptional regulator, regulatory protein PadR
MRQELLKGHLETLILAVLADRPLHGYAIQDAIRDRSDGGVEVEGGTLYPALHKLEAAGLISGRWSVESGRRRRTYSLTAKGTRALADKRSGWRVFVDTIEAFMSDPTPQSIK